MGGKKGRSYFALYILREGELGRGKRGDSSAPGALDYWGKSALHPSVHHQK